MKPRVLQLIDSFRVGGSEHQAVQLTRLLKESGDVDVHLACLNADGPLRAEVNRLNLGEIPVFELKSFHDRNAFVQLRRLANHLKRLNIDVIQTHDFYTNIFGMAAARLADAPVRIAARRESGKRSEAKRIVERTAYRLAHQVIANCDEVRRQLILEGVRPGKIVTIHNGLNLERISAAPNQARSVLLNRMGIPPIKTESDSPTDHRDQRIVTIIANIRPVKDHATFLRAAQRVYAALPETLFVIAGQGDLADAMRQLAIDLGLDRSTLFIGRCENVAELLAVSDVCVLSSNSEGFSNSILEYMAAGRPVVATDVGGAREAVAEGETGYLVNVGDHIAMAGRIISLLRDPALASQMGQRGRAIVEREFSCELQLERTLELYDRLLQRRVFPVRQSNGETHRRSA